MSSADASDRPNGPTHEDVTRALDAQQEQIDEVGRQLRELQARFDEMTRRIQPPAAGEGAE